MALGRSGTYKARSAGFKEIAVGPEVAAAVISIAAKGLAVAQGLAQPFRETGDYADSFNVHADIVPLRTRFGSHMVAAGVLENTSEHAAAVEWGNKDDSKAHHVLERTAEALSHE